VIAADVRYAGTIHGAMTGIASRIAALLRQR